VVEPAPPSGSTEAACQIEDPVRLVSLAAPSAAKGTIGFPDKPVVACRLALPLSQWAAEIAAPVLGAKLGSPLASIRTGPGFACRPRNQQRGEKLSAHGSGLAIDLSGFELADGRTLGIAAGSGPVAASREGSAAFAALRIAACGWFLTVLGPGSDAFHSTHLHLDIQQHGSSDRYRICQ
jgi:hypothetical protein